MISLSLFHTHTRTLSLSLSLSLSLTEHAGCELAESLIQKRETEGNTFSVNNVFYILLKYLFR